MKGIDVSNFSGIIGVTKAKELKSLGYDFAIVGTQVTASGGLTQGQIDDLRAGGIEVRGVYELLYWDERDMSRMAHAMTFGLPVWVDVEVAPQFGPAAILAHIREALERLGSQAAGIYTGKWWWEPNTGNSTLFKDWPLWHAGYQPQAYVGFQSYGGWEKPAVWQYSDQGVAGLNCDLNETEEVVPVADVVTQDQLRLAAVQAMLTKYDFKVTGENMFHQTVVQLMEKDGTEAQPSSFLAVEVK